MSGKTRIIKVWTSGSLEAKCESCGSLLASGHVMLVLAEGKKLRGIMVGESMVHCGKIHPLPLFFDDKDRADVFISIYIAGVDDKILKEEQTLDMDPLSPEHQKQILTRLEELEKREEAQAVQNQQK